MRKTSKKALTAAPKLSAFTAIQPRRLYQQIAEQIEAYIASGGLNVGDRLPAERELALHFGVSRPSVREAMIALEGAGLIEVRTGDGTFVRRIVPRDWRLVASSDPNGDPGPGALEQFEARLVIEPELAYLAASKVGPEEIATLKAAVDEAEAHFAKGETADEADYAFHVQLANYSQNKILADVVRHLWDLREGDMWRVIRSRVARPEHKSEVIRYRRNIIEALEEGDAAQSKNNMYKLISRAIERYFG